MTISLPDDLERFIRAEVQRGHFVSEDDAIAEAVRLLRQRSSQRLNSTAAVRGAVTQAPDPVFGAMQDAVDEMDDIVAEAMAHREQQLWRLPPRE